MVGLILAEGITGEAPKEPGLGLGMLIDDLERLGCDRLVVVERGDQPGAYHGARAVTVCCGPNSIVDCLALGLDHCPLGPVLVTTVATAVPAGLLGDFHHQALRALRADADAVFAVTPLAGDLEALWVRCDAAGWVTTPLSRRSPGAVRVMELLVLGRTARAACDLARMAGVTMLPQLLRRMVTGTLRVAAFGYSHSMVAGGLELTS